MKKLLRRLGWYDRAFLESCISNATKVGIVMGYRSAYGHVVSEQAHEEACRMVEEHNQPTVH